MSGDSVKPETKAGREPTTEAGRRLNNDVREVVIHGVTDRVPAAGFGLAWHVRRGIAAIEAEARDAALREVEEAVAGLVVRDAWEGDEADGKVHDHIEGECGFRSAVTAAITRLRQGESI